jgi:hypothetical protein
MTVVAEAEHELPASEHTKSEVELLDALYEVLAQGVPAGSEVTTADVERFLHEHARSRKSHAEMLAFFQRHNLSTDAATYGADSELSQLASGLHRGHGPISAMLPLDAEPLNVPQPTESGEVRRALPPTELEESSTVRTRNQAQAALTSGRGWKLATGALALCSLLGFGLSFQRGQELQEELQRARLQLRATDNALTSLEQRAERLRGSLDQSEMERRALAGRFEQFSSDALREQAAEQDVLRRMLGKRYDTLRTQVSRETLAAQLPKP